MNEGEKEKLEIFIYFAPNEKGLIKTIKREFPTTFPTLDTVVIETPGHLKAAIESKKFKGPLFLLLAGDIGIYKNIPYSTLDDIAIHNGVAPWVNTTPDIIPYSIIFAEAVKEETKGYYTNLLIESLKNEHGTLNITPQKMIAYNKRLWNRISNQTGIVVPPNENFKKWLSRAYIIESKENGKPIDFKYVAQKVADVYAEYVCFLIENMKAPPDTYAARVKGMVEHYIPSFDKNERLKLQILTSAKNVINPKLKVEDLFEYKEENVVKNT